MHQATISRGFALTNYYDILGLKVTANLSDIKTAFRKLAKQFHPDKNPEGKERFEQVLKAYETLSDPVQRSAYDHKLKYYLHRPAQTQSVKKGKNWRFDEKELKRRKYYDEHIRKHAKTTASYNAMAEEKKTYNEFKYILFATPLAVALFLLIMRLANPEPPKINPSFKQSGQGLHRTSGLNADSYNKHFGQPYTTHDTGISIKLYNAGPDAIVCFFSGLKFVRCIALPGGGTYTLNNLPDEVLSVRYTTGDNFDPQRQTDSLKIKGAFSKQLYYYKDLSMPSAEGPLELGDPDRTGFKRITEKLFFKKT